jgi:hypothetical protein
MHLLILSSFKVDALKLIQSTFIFKLSRQEVLNIYLPYIFMVFLETF